VIFAPKDILKNIERKLIDSILIGSIKQINIFNPFLLINIPVFKRNLLCNRLPCAILSFFYLACYQMLFVFFYSQILFQKKKNVDCKLIVDFVI